MIRVVCPQCGTVELEGRLLRLVPATLERESGLLAFTCPFCWLPVEHAIDPVAVARLEAAGAVTSRGPRPQRRPPMTVDDLIDLHELLAREDALERLTEARARRARRAGRGWPASP